MFNTLNYGILANYPSSIWVNSTQSSILSAYAKNLALWLDATDTTTVILSSSNYYLNGTAFPIVSAWKDKSGNNRHFYAYNPRTAPIFLPAAQSDLKSNSIWLSAAPTSDGAYYNQDAKFLYNKDYTWGNSLSSQISIFCVATIEDTTIATIISQSGSTTNRRQLQFSLNYDDSNSTSTIKYTQGNTSGDVSTGDNNYIYYQEGNDILKTGNFFGTNINSESTGSFFINRKLTKASVLTSLDFGLSSSSFITIGISPFSLSVGDVGTYNAEATYNTQLSELIIFNTNLPTNVSEGIIKYLQNKYFARPYALLVGGGGGGGTSGGGGAGGLIFQPIDFTKGVTYSINVGAGGTGGSSNTGDVTNQKGTDTTIVGLLTAYGGGGGGNAYNTSGGSGGSGGGGGGNSQSQGGVGGAGTLSQGLSGGNGGASGVFGGSGGGAGEFGKIGLDNTAVTGGNGLQINITGTATYYAGGGASSSIYYSGSQNPIAAGGLGGGGATRTSGTINTGGGGGAGGYTTGGTGGKGIVILKIPTANYSGITTGSPSISKNSIFTILTYNSSGTYTA